MKPCKANNCDAKSLRNSDHCLACTKKVGSVTRELSAALEASSYPAIREKLEGFLRRMDEQERKRAVAQQRLHRRLRRDEGVQWASVADINNTEAVKIR